SMTAESMLLLVLAIWVKGLTGSDRLAVATIFALVAPMGLAPLVGWFVDRFRRRPFLILAHLSVAALLTPLLLVADRSDIWIIFAVAAAYGLSYIAVAAALQGLIKEVVPEQHLAEANGALQTVKQGLRLVGPLGGAGLYTLLGGPAVAAITSLAFVASATVMATIPVREQRPERGELRWLSEASAGIRHLVGNVAIRRLVLGAAMVVLALGLTEALLFAYVDRGLGRPEAFLGVLSAALGLGGIVGGLVAAAVIRRLGEMATAGAGLVILATAMVGFVRPQVRLGLAAAAVAGLGVPLLVVSMNTLLQRRTPQHLMGRTVAAVEVAVMVPQTVAIGAGAVLVEMVDYRLLFACVAVGVTAAGLYLWTGRRLSSPETSRRRGPKVPTAVAGDSPGRDRGVRPERGPVRAGAAADAAGGPVPPATG